MNEQKNEQKNEENNKIPVNDKPKEIKKYHSRAEKKAALVFQLYNLIQGK